MNTQSTVARIPNRQASVTFLQLWETESETRQEGWLDTMNANIHLLRVKPGFVCMMLHRSFDHRNLCVYAQWVDKKHLEAAADDPMVKEAREKLDSWARPDGRVYAFHSLVSSPTAPLSTLQIEPDALISFVNVWNCGDPDRQRKLLGTMEEEILAISSQTGFLGMALHTSLDGRYVGVYARWQSLAAFQAAVEDNPEARRGRNRLSRWGALTANAFRVEGIYLPLR